MSGNADTAPLLKRAFIFLEDGDWSSADEYCEKVLDLDPECAQAYLGKLLAELKLNNESALANLGKEFIQMNNCQKAIRYGDDDLKLKLEKYNKQAIYNGAEKAMGSAETDIDFRSAGKIFEQLGGYSDSKQKAEECEKIALEKLYNRAVSSLNSAETDVDFRSVAELFKNLGDYSDSKQKVEECEKIALEKLYNQAVNSMDSAENEDDFYNAAEKFRIIGDYQDSIQKTEECLEKSNKCRRFKNEIVNILSNATKNVKIGWFSRSHYVVDSEGNIKASKYQFPIDDKLFFIYTDYPDDYSLSSFAVGLSGFHYFQEKGYNKIPWKDFIDVPIIKNKGLYVGDAFFVFDSDKLKKYLEDIQTMLKEII